MYGRIYTLTVRFTKGNGYAEIDFFDLMPAEPAALTCSVYKLINPNSGKALDAAGESRLLKDHGCLPPEEHFYFMRLNRAALDYAHSAIQA